jgi:hypothetical protein
MAVSDKRLFWISIVIVELVLLYVVWRPNRNHFVGPSHRIAGAPRVIRQPELTSAAPELKPPAIVIASRKPSKVTPPKVRAPQRPVTVNASLKEPEPLPAVPVSVLVPQAALGPRGGFWCHLAMVGTTCDCEVRSAERADNLGP